MQRAVLNLMVFLGMPLTGIHAQTAVPPSAILDRPEVGQTTGWRWISLDPGRGSETGWVSDRGDATVMIDGQHITANLTLLPSLGGADRRLTGTLRHGHLEVSEVLLNTDAGPMRVHGTLLQERVGDVVEERIVLHGGPSGDASFLAVYRQRAVPAAERTTPSTPHGGTQ